MNIQNYDELRRQELITKSSTTGIESFFTSAIKESLGKRFRFGEDGDERAGACAQSRIRKRKSVCRHRWFKRAKKIRRKESADQKGCIRVVPAREARKFLL